MKKLKGTSYARIGTSYTPIRDSKLDELEAAVLAQQARLDALIQRAKALMEKGE